MTSEESFRTISRVPLEEVSQFREELKDEQEIIAAVLREDEESGHTQLSPQLREELEMAQTKYVPWLSDLAKQRTRLRNVHAGASVEYPVA
jgi:translation initiation factor 2 alpha subunit (eIF-2alpha)